jgi:hypothetical protein
MGMVHCKKLLTGTLFSLLLMPIAHAQTVPPRADTPATTPAPAAPQLQVPPPEIQVILIRNTLAAINQANLVNNYAVLNALGSSGFRVANPPAALAKTFETMRNGRIDLSPLAIVNPQLTAQAAILNNQLRLVGNFPTQPMRVDFDLTYEVEAGGWRLFGLAVNLQRAAPTSAAPALPPPLPAPRPK